MFKLTKSHLAFIEQIRSTNAEISTDLEQKHQEYVNAVGAVIDAVALVNEAVQDFNSALEVHRQELRDISEDFISAVADFRTEYEDKSEKWQESDRGQATSSWLEELEDIAQRLEDATIAIELEEIDEPSDEELEYDLEDLWDQLESISTQPEY